MDLSRFGIGDGTSESSVFTIPGLENLQNMFSTIMTASMVIGGLFIVLYIINLIQRIRADRSKPDTTRNAPRAAMKPRGLPPSQPVRTTSAIAAPS